MNKVLSILMAGGCIGACLLATSRLRAADEMAPPRCGPPILVSGSFDHFKTPTGRPVTGTTQPELFAEEIYGRSFTVTVPGLPGGKYLIKTALIEAYHDAPGQRLMSIASGKTTLTRDLDIFAAAGGAYRAYEVSGQVQHDDDAVGGPLVLSFQAAKDNAKFNAVSVLDDQGKTVACVQASDLADVAGAAAKAVPAVHEPILYTDPSQPVQARAHDLVRRMSLAEKVAQLHDAAPAIERLKLPAFWYWNECLHGVARAGAATVFPEPIGLAATWDPALIGQMGDAIATEGRAKYHDAVRRGKVAQYYCLTYWTPNINILRDP